VGAGAKLVHALGFEFMRLGGNAQPESELGSLLIEFEQALAKHADEREKRGGEGK
jgi:hypothetical protein